MIKAIVFDFFGVLCSDEYWRFVGADRQGDSKYHQYADAVNKGLMQWNEFVAKVAEATNSSIDDVNALYKTELLNPLMAGELSRLHGHYKLGLITNASSEYIRPLLRRAHIEHYFDALVISSEIGITKPDERIFEYAIQSLGLEPHEIIYIDDLERHVTAAKEAGMNAFMYQDYLQFRDDLERVLADSKH